MTDITWTNEKRKVSDLVAWEKNPRKITDEQLEHLKRSLEKFNYAAPVVINFDNRIIAGHMRCRALVALGRGDEIVDVRIPNRQLSEDEAFELTIRDNANGGDWDLTAMKDFNLDALFEMGFDSDKVDKIRDKVKEDNFDAEEEVGKIETPQTTPGVLYILGRHRLLCGDSTKAEDFARLMDGRKARLIFTDPPYSVNYKSVGGNSYSKGKYSKYQKAKAIFSDDKEGEAAIDFYVAVLKNLYEFSTDDVSLYWWFAQNLRDIENRLAWMETGWQVSQVLAWLKETMVFSMGADYHRLYEPCLFGWKRGGEHFSNKKLATYKDVFMLDPVDFARLPDVWYENRDKTSDYIHPTQKPIRLAERALRKNSQPGDVVLDAFGGSGSTMMACEQMDRTCMLIELDPKYCDVIVKRWEEFTGKKAKIA